MERESAKGAWIAKGAKGAKNAKDGWRLEAEDGVGGWRRVRGVVGCGEASLRRWHGRGAWGVCMGIDAGMAAVEAQGRCTEALGI